MAAVVIIYEKIFCGIYLLQPIFDVSIICGWEILLATINQVLLSNTQWKDCINSSVKRLVALIAIVNLHCFWLGWSIFFVSVMLGLCFRKVASITVGNQYNLCNRSLSVTSLHKQIHIILSTSNNVRAYTTHTLQTIIWF